MIQLCAGDKDRLLPVEWTTDTDLVVLEVPQEGSKVANDSDRTTWRNLLHELETEAEIVDASINSHELKRSNQEGGVLTEYGCQMISIHNR